jgi:hypothetical protein
MALFGNRIDAAVSTPGSVSLYILLSTSFSKILDITGKRLIGLYEVTSVRFFSGFGIMIDLCVF